LIALTPLHPGNILARVFQFVFAEVSCKKKRMLRSVGLLLLLLCLPVILVFTIPPLLRLHIDQAQQQHLEIQRKFEAERKEYLRSQEEDDDDDEEEEDEDEDKEEEEEDEIPTLDADDFEYQEGKQTKQPLRSPPAKENQNSNNKPRNI
jgi:hypothetical protein